ncbi:MAG: hypothetical protein K2H32_05460 [Muribaculaceae bacterium]|nr:hypothetical protein [Muribaculaceae bacterium]MDE7156138.1 hypothetical protein [Muribaculaceae bacterium]MDE7368868.1 hypothetical protein [Muribaculaceae bacterium]
MKRVFLMIMTVIVCSLSAWSQSSMIVELGTEVIENNSFSSAYENFRKHGMPLHEMPSGKYGYMSERPLLMAVLDETGSEVNEVDFLCGAAMWWGIDSHLEENGYSLTKEGYTTLGNGASVSQKTFLKGNIICLVQTLDNDMKQVIFKRKPTSQKKRTTR